MSKIIRRNVFTDEIEEVEFEGGVERIGEVERKTYSTAYSTPQVSIAAGCHSAQVKEFNEYYKRMGIVGAEHREDGALVANSRRAFNRVLEARSLFNRDASYGDYAGNATD